MNQKGENYMNYDISWAKTDINNLPKTVAPALEPYLREFHDRSEKSMKGYSSQTQLFSVAFGSGH